MERQDDLADGDLALNHSDSEGVVTFVVVDGNILSSGGKREGRGAVGTVTIGLGIRNKPRCKEIIIQRQQDDWRSGVTLKPSQEGGVDADQHGIVRKDIFEILDKCKGDRSGPLVKIIIDIVINNTKRGLTKGGDVRVCVIYRLA